MSTHVVSDRKIEANRQNALKSTGPKSDDGKARSSKNARKHLIFCKDLIVPGEDPAAFAEFKREMLRTLNPRNILDLQLVEQVIADEWRIKRVRAAERAAYERAPNEERDTTYAEQRKEAERELKQIKISYAASSRPAFAAQRHDSLETYLKQFKTPIDLSSLPPGTPLEQAMRNGPGLERLAKYERRLRNSVHRALKELRILRAQKEEEMNEFTSELLDDANEQAIEKNEATDSPSDGEEMTSTVDSTPGELEKDQKELATKTEAVESAVALALTSHEANGDARKDAA